MERNGIALEQTLTAALEAIEGMKERVCPVVDIQKSTGPLVVYDQRKESSEKALSGSVGLQTAGFQIHVLHNTYLKMRKLSEQVKAAMEGLQGYHESPLLIESADVELVTPDILEDKVQLFRRTYNATFMYQIEEE